ncbi:helix-turn-helix domain-containing protein [Listeria welshimeri]|uniref:helix-turn-helix domain-containing protein n=1 Tax=Listeria welshimeri TaxID=1643 RepID=UPI001623EE29|nr:helix-turn-helix domain-containing protein [Listeria welshimeri]MBC1979799.1 helix-turn-helix domain-containing protein [Listeria welshimeri]MBF2378507.1 helix-turn-helix domain-containing protein [Listeria welshimeri]MBF2504970.1 helix-turn-helix domain-containing protein [Listeria welshimeri]MBF2639186.1 helix-turn-helix domain-containing protein [Listeria welshimeri]MBF2657390.1 helix-turn-helix domain-containing protein [Listeria welshimeri]
MKHIGETIKQIRINKNITQKQMHSVKQSSLAAIEQNKRLPSIEIFLNILRDLDIDMIEFFYIHNNFKLPERDHLFKLFREQKQSLNTEYIYNLKEQYDIYLSKNNDTFIESLNHILDIYLEINKQQTFDIEHEKSFDLWDKIADQKVWYHNDIYILTKIFYIFTPEQSEHMISKALKELKKYANYPGIHEFRIAFLLNCSKHYILSNRILESEKHLTEAYNLAEKHQIELLKLTANYLLAYVDYSRGEKKLATSRFEHTVDSFEILNRNLLRDDIIFDWNNFIINNMLNELDLSE